MDRDVVVVGVVGNAVVGNVVVVTAGAIVVVVADADADVVVVVGVGVSNVALWCSLGRALVNKEEIH